MASKIVERIEAQSGRKGLFDLLARDLPGSDLQSLLLEVYRARSTAQTAAGVLARFARGGLSAPSDVDSRSMHELEGCAYEAARAFEAVELAPAQPLGAHSVLGGIDQNNVLTTVRNAEVPGDPTTALSLEAALRRRRDAEPVRLCAVQRVVRLQPFDVPGFSPHFKLFGLVSAGRDTGRNDFECESLREHVAVYLRLFRLLNERGFHLGSPRVEVTDHRQTAKSLRESGIAAEVIRDRIRAHRLGGSEEILRELGVAFSGEANERLQRVEDRVFKPLGEEFGEASFVVQNARLEGFGYYPGLCLRISPATRGEERFPIVDGGFVDWTARMLSNRKERLLASGVGIEFICRRYR